MRPVLVCAVLLLTGNAEAAKAPPYYCPNTVSAAPAGWTVASVIPAFAAQTFTYVTHADGQAEGLDLYMPPGVADPPLIVMVHGGGFTAGTRQQFINYVTPYVAQGFAVANLSYRLAGTFDTTNGGHNPAGVIVHDPAVNTFPAALQDVRCAVRYLSANAATLGYSSAAVAAYGASAGGNLVAMLGTTLDYDPAIYGTVGGAPQTLDSADCPIGSSNDPAPVQNVLAPAAVQLVIDESGNDTIGQTNNTPDNSAWGNVQYPGDVSDMAHLFNVKFKVPAGQSPACTAPGFAPRPAPHCVTLAGLAGNPAFQNMPFPLAYPDTQFANNAANPAYISPMFFILNGALDPVVGPQNSADLFNTMTGANAAGTPVLVEPTMQNAPGSAGVVWSAPAISTNAAQATYFLMPDEGHIPALLAPGLTQNTDNNNGANADLQAASCAVRNILFQVLQLPAQ